jgi:hypothetical protein
LLKVGMSNDPLVEASQQPAFRVLDPLLVLARICCPYVLYAASTLGVE